MENQSLYRPRVSRETRTLLSAGLAALAVLWLLARFRFQDEPVTPNPIPAVLSQITRTAGYDELATEIGRSRARLESLLVPLSATATGATHPAGLRIGVDEAVAFIPDTSTMDSTSIVGRDPASGLAVVRVGNDTATPPVVWTPRQLDSPRYFLVGDFSAAGVAVRPAFVEALHPASTALWPDVIWTLPLRSDLEPGSFVFTIGDAELVGIVIVHGGRRAIVPGTLLLAEAERMKGQPSSTPAAPGIDVQTITDTVAQVTRASSGVVVTFVTPGGPGEGRIRVGDVIEAIEGQTLLTREEWDVRVSRLSAGNTFSLRVRRQGVTQDVALTAAARPTPPRSQSLGLVLRNRAGLGTEVIGVERFTAGSRAGLVPGDIITLVDDRERPTPADVRRSFAALRENQRTLLAAARGTAHFVTTLER